MNVASKSATKQVRIAVFGHVGQDNLGDEAAFKAVVEATKSRRPNAEIIGISVNPMDTTSRYGIPAYPIWRDALTDGTKSADNLGSRQEAKDTQGYCQDAAAWLKAVLRRVPLVFTLTKAAAALFKLLPVIGQETLFLWRSRRVLRHVDLLAVAGSQHLNDYVLGPWNFPYTTWKWTILSKLTGTKVAFLNVGAGPLRTRLGQWLIKWAVILSDYQSYRDISSVRCIQKLGLPVSRPPVPDLVFTLKLPEGGPSSVLMTQRKIVGINPIPFSSADYWVGASEKGYQSYVAVLGTFAKWLLSRDYKVVFFPTQLTLDPLVIRDIRMQINEIDYEPGAVTEACIKSIDDLSAAIASMDFVVASRFHGLIFSMLLEKPVLGISYAEKGRDLMAYMGQSRYVLDIMTLDFPTMQKRFEEIEAGHEPIKSVLREMKSRHRLLVEAQFDDVFALVD